MTTTHPASAPAAIVPEHEFKIPDPGEASVVIANDLPLGRWFKTESVRKDGHRLYERIRTGDDGLITVEQKWCKLPDDDERPRRGLGLLRQPYTRRPSISQHRIPEQREQKRDRLGLFCLYFVAALVTLEHKAETLSQLTDALYRHDLNTWCKEDIKDTFARLQEGTPMWEWTRDLEGRLLPDLTQAGRWAVERAEVRFPNLDVLGESGIEQ